LIRIKRVAQSLLDALEHTDLQATQSQYTSLRLSLKAQTFADFDQHAISQLLGYPNADTYYQAESADQYLDHLHTPLYIALNQYDPFIPYQQQRDVVDPYLGENSLLYLQSYQRGGHIYGGRSDDQSAFGACLRWIAARAPTP
jgi:predicted alpha/beta-fold hydrolase